MKNLIESVLENLSTREYFLFRIFCEVCGAAYGNRTVRFSKAAEAQTAGERKCLFDALYEQEFRSVRLSAIREAAEHLNYCPVCKRLACNRCFLVCEDLDLCTECAKRLNVKGSPVISYCLVDTN